MGRTASSARFLSWRISDANPVGEKRQTDPRAENHLNFNTEGERKHFRIHALLSFQLFAKGFLSVVRMSGFSDLSPNR